MELKIVVAALARRDGLILVTRRPEGKHLAGYWEFPGGKREEGESPERALEREMLEELGMSVVVGSVFAVVFHRYETFELLMLVYECEPGPAEPQAIDCSELRWVKPRELPGLRMPPADEPVVRQLLARPIAGRSRSRRPASSS